MERSSAEVKKRVEITVACDQCSVMFSRRKSDVNYSLKRNKKLFCSPKCVGKHNMSFDTISQFKEYIRRIKRRNYEVTLTIEDLKNQWDKQSGRCIYTGIQLKIADYTMVNDPINTASLDRIDSKKGYIISNIQFVSTAINYMKNSMTHENTIKLCRIIANFHLHL